MKFTGIKLIFELKTLNNKSGFIDKFTDGLETEQRTLYIYEKN